MTFPLMPWTGSGSGGGLFIRSTSSSLIEVGDVLILYRSQSKSGRTQNPYGNTAYLAPLSGYTTMAVDGSSSLSGESPGGYVEYSSVYFRVEIKVAVSGDIGLTHPNTTRLYVIGSTDPSQTLSHASQATGSVDFDAAPGSPVGIVYAGINADSSTNYTIPGDGTVTNQVADVSYGHGRTSSYGTLTDSGATKINIFHNGEEGNIPGTETIANGTGTDSRSWQLIYGV